MSNPFARAWPPALAAALAAWLAAAAGAGEAAAPPSPTPLPPSSFAAAAARVLPATVSLTVRKLIPGGPGGGRGTYHELGSGFVVREDGLILTNQHVVANALELFVTLYDRRRLPGQVAGQDPDTDLAVVRLEGVRGLPVAAFGDVEALRVGDWVLAAGNPLGLGWTVTRGIVSAQGRGGLNYLREEFLLQTDAALNRGSSGGPLANLQGEVVGIATAIPLGQREGFLGVGFAVPADTIRRYLPDLLAGRPPVRSWAGLAAITDVDPNLARRLGLPGPGGVLVQDVIEDSPAAQAGLRPQDVLLDWRHRSLPDGAHLAHWISVAQLGEEVPLGVWREGERLELTLRLAARPEQETALAEPGEEELLGLVPGELSAELAYRLGLESLEGVVVRQVNGGAALAAGLRRFDVIVELGGAPTPNREAFRRAAAALPEGEPAEVVFNRAGQLSRTTLRP